MTVEIIQGDALEVLKELDRFQHFYASNTMEKGMPGNEFYSEKAMAIVERARALLARHGRV